MSLLVALCAWVGPDQTHTGDRLLGHRRSGSWGSGWRPWGTVPTALLTEPCHPSPLQLAPGVNSGQGLGIEIIGTLQLVLCVLATTDRRRRDLGGSAPLAIGFSVALGHLLAVSGGPSQVGVGRAEPGRCPVEDSGWDLDRAHSTGWGDQLPVRGMPRDRPTIFLSLFVPSLFPPLSSLSISPCHPLASSPSACFSVSCPARCPHPDRLHRLRH